MTRASPEPKLSKCFYGNLSKLRNNHEFEDFQVKVDGDIYPCHSFLLATCSEFFRNLISSDMKEKHEMAVELSNISSPTFQLILNSLYTGCELLTKENVLEIWSAVHHLQINLLIEHCEDFVIDNVSLDTVDSYKTHADFFQSQKVCEYIFNFILQNFETLREKEIFFQMDFQFLKRLLESDKLEVSSEDVILYSIFKWVDYTHLCVQKSGAANESDDINTLQDNEPNEINEEPKKENSSLETNGNANTEEQKIDSKNPDKTNERKKYLGQLLKSTRYYLASENCISKLYKHNLAQNDIYVKEILLQVLIFNFKLSDLSHGHWPTAAIHRNCSDLEHVGLFCDVRGILALSFKQEKWYSVPNINRLKYSNLTVLNGKLYAYSEIFAFNNICVLNTNRWELVTVVKNAVNILLAHEKSIYILDSIKKVFIKFKPDTSPIQLETIGHELQNPEFALSFYDNIIVFCYVDNNGHEETAVHSWNTKKNEWTQLENLEFSSKNMTSFSDDLNTYILNSNGNLWKLTNTEVIGFKFVAKLWSVKYDVRGAVLFRETLYVFGESQYYVDMLKEVEGVYSRNIAIKIPYKTSNFIHYVIPKRNLEPLKTQIENRHAGTNCNIL